MPTDCAEVKAVQFTRVFFNGGEVVRSSKSKMTGRKAVEKMNIFKLIAALQNPRLRITRKT